MLIPPACERVPGPGVTTGATDADWETMSIPPDRGHVPGVSVATGAPGPDQEMMRIRQTANTCLVPAVVSATLSLCGFTLTMLFWSRYVSFKTGAGCDVPLNPSRKVTFSDTDAG